MRLLRPAAPLLLGVLLALPAAAQRTTRPAPKPAPKTAVPAPAPAPPAPPTTGYFQGVATDSIHLDALVGAVLQIEGTRRLAPTDSLGRFLVDSVPPGTYRVIVDHPLLDTLGIQLVTPPLTFAANEITRTTVSVPSAETLVGMFCPAARRALGPGALFGRVREPDTDVPAEGARVTFVWYDPDPPGLPPGLRMGKKPPRVREGVVGADGTYRLCGLPERYEGKLQAQRKDGGATAEVTVTQEGGVLALRSMTVAPLPVVARGDTSAAKPATKGSARVLGKVLNANGAPVANARIALLGGSTSTTTRANGDFVLDSLPSGTQALVVRQLGYKPTEVPVELSQRVPARVTVRLGVFVPELTPVEVTSRRDEGLQKVGFLDRRRTGTSGYYLGPEQLEKRNAQMFTDLLRTVPGIRVQTQNGQAEIVTTRSQTGNGCVTMWLDGGQQTSLSAGDLDTFVQPSEVAAIEVYQGAGVPPQFTTLGQNCAAVVVWTKTRVLRRGK